MYRKLFSDFLDSLADDANNTSFTLSQLAYQLEIDPRYYPLLNLGGPAFFDAVSEIYEFMANTEVFISN